MVPAAYAAAAASPAMHFVDQLFSRACLDANLHMTREHKSTTVTTAPTTIATTLTPTTADPTTAAPTGALA